MDSSIIRLQIYYYDGIKLEHFNLSSELILKLTPNEGNLGFLVSRTRHLLGRPLEQDIVYYLTYIHCFLNLIEKEAQLCGEVSFPVFSQI